MASASISARFTIASILWSASPSMGGSSGISNSTGTMRLFTSVTLLSLMSAEETEDAATEAEPTERVTEDEEEDKEEVETDVETEVVVVFEDTVCFELVTEAAEALGAAAAAGAEDGGAAAAAG